MIPYMALFAMSDEPGWYYPQMFEPLKKNPAALARFREYLKSQGLKPSDVGASKWEDVQPLGRSNANALPGKRLFYWTMRFFPYDSARHFARSTKALEEAFYPGVPVLTNWNFFSGRFCVPGPMANNRDKQDPDAAKGGHDWLTEPNVPAEQQRGLVQWVKSRGTLVTVSGAASHDRYNEPCEILSKAAGVKEQTRERMLIRYTNNLPDVGSGDGSQGGFTAVGIRGDVQESQSALCHRLPALPAPV